MLRSDPVGVQGSTPVTWTPAVLRPPQGPALTACGPGALSPPGAKFGEEPEPWAVRSVCLHRDAEFCFQLKTGFEFGLELTE